eukprot:CAMPEP_0198144330 /NCGR_PEP_ID=MMETSP1443-20131203/14608_1 /TAXON_ID=186043 /ORGANISM="Entomoneis sp., Strain CCMP2396" /LENGTH=212 /DNA_ID=CAMNT_0043807701 /DNA_START=127 /DNA_END=761 /DNA_ORIENTATION=-
MHIRVSSSFDHDISLFESDQSVSSTQDVAQMKTAPVSACSPPRSKGCFDLNHHHSARRVRFDESSNVVTYQIERGLWYSSEDQLNFEQEHTANAKAIIRADGEKPNAKCCRSAIERLYDACCSSDSDDVGDLNLAPLDAQYFEEWLLSPYNRLGLERSTVGILREDRRIRREELLGTVLGIQEECSDMPLNEKEVLISQESRAVSRAPRLYA